MESATQRKAPSPPDGSDVTKVSGLKRLAPESTGLMEELKQQAKAKSKTTFEQKKRQILERCGCL